VASLAVILVVLGLTLIDTGLSRRRNVLDTVVQKLAAPLIAGFATFMSAMRSGRGREPARVELGAGSH
jgi:ammonia channel protein AmtB